MREIIARIVCGLTVVFVVAVSLLFAHEHNPSGGIPSTEVVGRGRPLSAGSERMVARTASEQNHERVAGPSAAEVERGRAVYSQQKCATCHSIGGQGNPRNSLDGAGTRWDAKDLRDWVTGVGVATEVLSPAIAKRKRQYQSMRKEDLDALVAYLSELKSTR